MEYIKFEIDELTNNSVFCQYREITEEGKGPLLQRSFPLEKIGPEVPRIPDMVKGTITNIYYEQRGDFIITEKKDINNTIVPLTEDEISFCIDVVKNACIDETWDELLIPKPLSKVSYVISQNIKIEKNKLLSTRFYSDLLNKFQYKVNSELK